MHDYHAYPLNRHSCKLMLGRPSNAEDATKLIAAMQTHEDQPYLSRETMGQLFDRLVILRRLSRSAVCVS